jgi:formylmethanofuran dehydrogenase subunit E
LFDSISEIYEEQQILLDGIPFEKQYLDFLLKRSASRHKKLCPRQVLGVRMGLYGADLLDILVPDLDKRLFVIVEMNGCFADGVEVATGCKIGKRTLQVEDLGKVAATFVDLWCERVFRISIKGDVRLRAFDYVDAAHNRYEAQLEGYQKMPEEVLFRVQEVHLKRSIQEISGRAGRRVVCDRCGEEVMNGREIVSDGDVLCKSCRGESYYVEVIDY